MFAPSHTILLITRQVLARIDLAGKRRPKVKQIWSQPGSDYGALLPEVVRALKLGPRPGSLTVVSPDFWTDILSLPADVLAIAGEHEMLQALALEAEVESGLSAFESRCGAFPLRAAGVDDKSYCVSQVANATLREFESVAKSNGTLLFGTSHPIAAQLSSMVDVTVEQATELLECWRDPASIPDEKLNELAVCWAKCIGLNPRMPLLVSTVEAPVTAQSVTWTASLALLAFGGCGLWHWQSQQCLASATLAIERLEKRQSQVDSIEAALKAAESQTLKLGSEVAKAQSARQATERQLDIAASMHAQRNRRWIALIDALAESTDGSCWVQRLESTSVQTVVHGIAIDNAAANRFAGQLERLLQGSGWQTMPAATVLAQNNLVNFQIVLHAKRKPTDSDAATHFSSNSVTSPAKDATSIFLAKGSQP